MTCTFYADGRHRLIVCDDPMCCPKGYVEACRCGERLGNAGRRARRAVRSVAELEPADPKQT